MDLVNFYRNESRSSGGYYLDEILAWGPDEWEASHEEIQFVFPTKQESVFNPDAPTLTDDEIELFKNDPELKEKFQDVLYIVLGVFGLRISGSNEFVWKEDCNFDPKWWLREFNHNYLRMTRIMDCLCKFGMQSMAFNLFIFLSNDKDADMNDTTRKHWKEASLGKK